MDKLNSIRQQKEQLRKRIMQLQGQKHPEQNLTEEAMAALYQRKAKLQHQRLQQEKYRKMEQQYNQRARQIERQKQLEKIKNQKRMIQLQVGMKRIVLNGVQQKVKGINSDQLLTRALLTNPDQTSIGPSKYQINKSKQDIKNEFQKYLSKQNLKKQQPKHDLYALNEKRYELFQKKQILVMRQVLLKQVINNSIGDENSNESSKLLQNLDIMKCSKEELQQLLQEHGIDIDEYMHPLNPKQIIDNYPTIQQNIKSNIKMRRHQFDQEQEKLHSQNIYRSQLKQWIADYPEKSSIATVRNLLDDLFDQIVFNYEKRHYALTKQQKQQRVDQLKKDYQKIQFQNQFYELAEQLVDDIQRRIKQQFIVQTAQQIHQLHQFAHSMTSMTFDWGFNKKNYLEYRYQGGGDTRIDQITLQFKDQSDNMRYDRKEDSNNPNNPDKKDNQQNVFQTQKLTSELISDIRLLAAEQDFFQDILIQINRQVIQSIDQNDFKLHVQNGTYVITPKNIKLINDDKDVGKTVITFEKDIKNVKNVKKLNNMWIVQTSDSLNLYSNWNTEKLPMAIAQRINSPCGNFTNLCIYPTFSLVGSLCTILLSFQKGQVMKYNFNRNRLNSIQTNVTHYSPLGPSIKTGDQAAFPLNNRNVIEYKNQKVTETQQMHQFRQFFDHHLTEIINVCYFKDNMFVTVDKGMNCSIWLYDTRRGTKSYQPYYSFILRSEYKIFKQSENARFKDLYPSSFITQSPEELYKKWMQHQTYLKLQIYNNPKKASAYFRSPKWDQEKNQQPVWKINYDDRKKQVIKIFQTYYNVIDGKTDCKQVQVWKQYLIVMIQKQHVLRNDLKTLKILVWSIDQKKMRTVAIQFDTFTQQKSVGFAILQNNIQSTNDYPLIVTISSGKILLFSMLSGQLLKDISQEQSCAQIKNYNFTSTERGWFNVAFYGVTRKSFVQFLIKNKNTKQKKQQFNKIVQIARKKYNNLV